jgi:hypothetical protein
MMKWADLARPKDFGGLGFTDTRLMNKCLLSKWIIKLDRGDIDLCAKILRNKYLKEKDFFSVMLEGGLQFWKRLHEAKHTCQSGFKYVVGTGNKPRFWHEVWLGERPLKIKFNKKIVICKQQNWEVARVLEGGVINLSFRRNFCREEILEWEELERELERITLFDREDFIRWALSANGQFSTSSLYMHCSFPGVVDIRMEELWKSKLPLKIKNFL